MKKHSIYIVGFLMLLGLGSSMPAYAQKKKAKKPKTTKVNRASLLIDVNFKVVDEDGNAIKNAEVIAAEGAVSTYTDADGKANLKTKANSKVLIESIGYEDYVVDLAKGNLPKIIKLKKTQPFSAPKYHYQRYDGGSTSQSDMVGAVYSISGNEINTQPDFNLSNILQGRLAGVTVCCNNSGLGNATSSIYVRGQHSNSDNTAIVIVDGIERDWNDIIPEEVEKIEVMKDATAKILYGSRAANGVLVITTRRGEANKRVIRTSFEAGIMNTTRIPQYLDSYQYATLYNEARLNDGFPAYYSQQQLDGYKNSTGPNDLLYPNVDYYDYFMGNNVNYRKALFDMNGGTDRIKYALIANYIGGDGLEKVGERPDLHRLNLRGNLDVKATSFLSLVADAAMRFEMRHLNSLDNGQVMSNISSTRPNEYPLTISNDILGLQPNEDGTPYFGSSLRHPSNLLADLGYGGYSEERYITSQTNLGLKFHLDEVLKGLSAQAFITFDNYSYYKKGQTDVYPTYAIIGQNADGTNRFVKMKDLNLQDNQSKIGEDADRRTGWRGNIGYENIFGKHNVEAMLAYNYYHQEVLGNSQDIKNSNTTLRLNYGFDNKYLVEGTLALMGSNKFYGSNKYFLSQALGAGWILSNEKFLKDINWLNYLKFKVSWGILGYDRATEWLLYKTAWNNGGSFSFGEQNTTSVNYTTLVRLGNTDLKWERSNEWNIGIEGLVLGNRLNFELNFFNELRSNIIGNNGAIKQDILGPFTMPVNIGTVRNHGIDFYAQWKDRIDDLNYSIGANIVWSKNKLLAWNEVNYPEEYLRTVGQSTDIMTGYQALGLYGKDVDLNRDVYQSFGPCQAGDIAYADLNGDKIIDGNDKTTLGNSFPRTQLGIDFNIGYKGWNLYVLGTAQLGMNTWKNNSYYWNKGEDKYSVEVLNRYHQENNPEGTYPRLTTTSGANNFMNSSFWIQDGSFFRLKNVELSYTFDFAKKNIGLKNLKLFARGANLFVISEEKNLDPEMMGAGVDNYPVLRTFTGGLTMTF